jgi:hypothetical protein
MERPKSMHVEKPWGRGPIRDRKPKAQWEREDSAGRCPIWGSHGAPRKPKASGMTHGTILREEPMERPKSIHVDKPWGRGPIRDCKPKAQREREDRAGRCPIWG